MVLCLDRECRNRTVQRRVKAAYGLKATPDYCLWLMVATWKKLCLTAALPDSQAASSLRDEYYAWALGGGKSSILSEERWNRFQKSESGCYLAPAKSFAQQSEACTAESIRRSFEHSPEGRDLSILPPRLRESWRSAQKVHTVCAREGDIGNPGILFSTTIMKDWNQLGLSLPERTEIRKELAEEYRNMTPAQKEEFVY